MRVAFLLTILLAYIWTQAPMPRCVVGRGDDLGCARGFQTREHADQRSFRWSDDHAWLDLHGAGWNGVRVLALTMAAARPDGRPVVVQVGVGMHQLALPVGTLPRRYLVLTQAAMIGDDRLRVDLHTTPFVPEGDQRDLGVSVFLAELLPTSIPRLPGIVLLLSVFGMVWAAGQLNQRRWPTSLAAAVLLGLGILLLPGRVLPFLPGLALIAGLAVWGLPQLGMIGIPRAAWLASGCGVALEAILITSNLGETLQLMNLASQAALVLLVVWLSIRETPTPALGALLGVALLVRLLAFAVRLLAGVAGADADTELFYNYGRATLELGAPVVEYPSGALLTWAILALPASRELFALAVLVLNLAADLAIVVGIVAITRAAWPGQPERQQFGTLLALAYATTPLLLPFWAAKYDSLPAALAILGVAVFLRHKPGLAGFVLGLGGALKWAPWLALPLLGWGLLRQAWLRRDQASLAAVLRLVAGTLLALLLTALPIALNDWHALLLPYTVQAARPLIGESVWFLPALLVEPALLERIAAPWSGTESAVITPTLTLVVQGLALLYLGLLAVLRAGARRTALLALLTPAVFLALNRVFSPQYLLPISAALLAAGALTLTTRRQVMLLVGLISLAQAANLLVWPYTAGFWPLASAVLFACVLVAIGWLVASRPSTIDLSYAD